MLVCFACMNWLFIAVSCFFVIFLLSRSLSFAGKMRQKDSSPSYAAGRRPWRISAPLWNASAQLMKLCTPQCAWLLKRLAFAEVGELTSAWHQNTKCYRAIVVCVGAERFMEIRAEVHFSWVYTFFAMFNSLRNCYKHDRYRLRPSTPAQLRWSSNRPQPLQKT